MRSLYLLLPFLFLGTLLIVASKKKPIITCAIKVRMSRTKYQIAARVFLVVVHQNIGFAHTSIENTASDTNRNSHFIL